MSFNLEAHLKDHALRFEKNGDILHNSIHFNFSFLDLQFLDKDTESTMSTLLDALLLPASYNVANGKRKDKHGNVVQKFTTRKVDLQKDVQAMAIHLKGPESEDTMPHIHFIADGSARFGNGYSLLKKHVSAVSKQFGLLPNFDEMVEHNPLSVKSLSRAVSQITWSWKKSTNAQLKSEIGSRGLDKSISLLKSYCLKTKNLTYYIKSMEGLKTRLNRMKLDIVYKGHHLRDTYPIPLREEDMEVIKLIQDKTFTQKAMQLYLKNPILRDFIRHSAGTSKPYIYDALKEQTNLLKNVSKNKQAVTSYKKLMQKETPIRKSQLTPKDNQNLSRKNELRRIIVEVSQGATNEKTFKSLMKNAGYVDFGLKKKQGKVLGCIYKELESKRTVNFTDLGLHWGELKKSFMLNGRKLENAETLPFPTLIKRIPTAQEITTSKIRTRTPVSVPLEYKSTDVSEKKKKAKEASKIRRYYEKVIPSIKAEIIKFEDFITRAKRGISDLREKIRSITARASEKFSHREEQPNLTLRLDEARSVKYENDSKYNRLEEEIGREEKNERYFETKIEEGYKSKSDNDDRNDRFREISGELEDTQSVLENGDYELYLHERIKTNIGSEEKHHQNLRGKISILERKIAIDTESKNVYSPPTGMRM
jgi:hypothetical protein